MKIKYSGPGVGFLDSRYLLEANNLSDLANASTARTNLGVAIGSDVQAWDANLDQIAALAPTDNNFIVGNGSAWTLETPSDARTSLGLVAGGAGDIWVEKAGDIMTGALQMGATAAITLGADGVAVFNEQGADVDFRVEGVGATHALFVRGSDGFVGINNQAPLTELHVVGNHQVSDAEAGSETKAYRFRTSGGALDFDGGGADLYISVYSGADFTGTQRTYMQMKSGSGNITLFKNWEWKNGSDQGVIAFNDSGGATFNALASDVDHRIASNNKTHMLFVDGGADVVLIGGTGAPQTNADFLQIESGWTFKEVTAPTADAGYGKMWTDADNELHFQSGDGVTHLIHGDAFSEIWFHNANTVEVTISTEDAFTKIDSFTVVGNEDDATNLVGSVANNNITLSDKAGGEYEISYHMSMTATGGADKEMVIALGITLATPKDITDVTDDLVTPIVITSTAHGLEDGDMVEIAGVLGNTAANGSFIVDNKAANTFEIVKLDGTATTGNGDFDAGSPTGDVTIEYPGNMVVHREVRGASLGALSATGLHILANSDVLAIYVANLDGTTNLTVAAVSFDAFRIGD